MVRKAESIGRKWESAFQEAVPDAVQEYKAEVPNLAEKVISAKDTALAEYKAALESPAYDNAVRSGLTLEKAGKAYEERLVQIGASGFTDSQKEKMVQETKVRRALELRYDAVILLATGVSGKLKFPDGVATVGLKKMILNTNVMKFISLLHEGSSANEIESILIANKTALIDMEVAT